ncbi:MAG: acyltransferase [Deltaproteobacteria bacterium]|nr:acyltransferase [Deltaproteobacteria bacterium]
MSVEAFFYVLFPFIAPLLLRGSMKKALGIAGFFWVASVSLSFAYHVFDTDELGRAVTHRDHAFWWEALKYHPLVRLPEFIIGMVAGRLLLARRKTNESSPQKSSDSSSSKEFQTLALILVSFGVVLSGLPHVFLHNALFAHLFAALFVLLGSANPPRILHRLEARPLLLLGKASYALYILHVPLLYWIAGIGERRTGRKILEEPVNALIALLFVVVVSVVVFRVVENPLRKVLRGKRE